MDWYLYNYASMLHVAVYILNELKILQVLNGSLADTILHTKLSALWAELGPVPCQRSVTLSPDTVSPLPIGCNQQVSSSIII